MKYKLIDLASVIRSKNSGPYEITFDVIFKDQAMFERVAASGKFNAAFMAGLYHVAASDVIGVVNFPPAKAIKATLKRPLASGNLGETDVYGAQQHGPLMAAEIEL